MGAQLQIYVSKLTIIGLDSDSAKPLTEPMLKYCQLDPWKQTSVKMNLILKFIYILSIPFSTPGKWGPFCLSLNMLNDATVSSIKIANTVLIRSIRH